LRRTLIRYILGMLHERLVKIIQEVSMDSHKIPVSPALQRLGEEFQALYGEKLEARGEARGEVRGAANTLLKVLAARGLAIDEARRAEVLACQEVAQLDRWVVQAAVANTLDDVFGPRA
jgi:hypothetical protein